MTEHTDIRVPPKPLLDLVILDCPDARDTNDDARIDLSDAVFLLTFLFLGGLPIPDPGPNVCGPDPTPDGLGPCPAPCT